MSELPPGWAETVVKDVCELRNGRAYKRSELLHKGKYPVLRVGNFFSNRDWYYSDLELEAEKYCDHGDLLYAWSASFGPKVWDGGKVIFHYHIWRVDIEPRLIEKRFLFHWFEWDKENIKSDLGTGSTMMHVTKGGMETRPLSLPPLPEQQRIVSKVGGLTVRTARARKDLDRIPTLIARYKQRLLELATSGELTADWRLKNDLPNPEIGKLSDLATELRYGSSSKSLDKGKVPVLRMGNIQDGKLDWTDLKYTSAGDEIEKFRLVQGDVLFNRTNSPQLVGKTALFDGEREAIFAGYLIRVRCGPSLMPEFLTLCLNSPSGRAYSWDVKTDGVSQSNINAKKLAAFTFLLPSMEEQAEIVQRIGSAFDWLDRVAADHAAAARLLPKLDAAILEKAFRGELVPQDPKDEPARTLLDRITKDRASYKAVKTSSQRNRKAKVRTPRKAKVSMTKSRHDPDVWQKPYLTELLKKKMKTASPEELFAFADLELVDFYHQLSTEYENGWLVEADGLVKAA